MSWWARSIANTLQFNADDDEDDEQHRVNNNADKDLSTDQQVEEGDSPLTPGRGVKEDLSEITKTLTRQLWGVASFLAPPPPAEHSNEESDPSDPEDASPEAISGIRRDFAEIGGRFRSGISKLSTNIDVSEITKMATNFLQLSPDGDDYQLSSDANAIGVTDEVVAFVRDITMHPETWLDFPLPEDEDDDEDFELSDAQQEHALTVESLAPRLAALRIELCPGYMSENSFWKIYFVLLHPRLKPQAAELLSTPEIVKARAALTREMKDRSKLQTNEEEVSGNKFPYSEQKPENPPEPSVTRPESELEPEPEPESESAPLETEKHPIPTEEVQIIDKSVIQEEPRNETKTQNQISVEANDEDDWLKEETSESVIPIPIENDEDVSFSDLEEEDGPESSMKGSRDWVQLGGSSGDSGGQGNGGKESNDWLDVDDIDVA
ncbi:hypothetical protein L1887_36119 [Cichorium endivia]|nr:hypothetical protein L1887_36119 [Cichorium endivia]